MSRSANLVTFAACAVLALTLTGPAFAASCSAGVTGSGQAANPLNYDPPKHYNVEKLAKQRAIAAWHEAVEAKCQHVSSHWWRARNKKIECDNHAGGLGCEATAIPARRIF